MAKPHKWNVTFSIMSCSCYPDRVWTWLLVKLLWLVAFKQVTGWYRCPAFWPRIPFGKCGFPLDFPTVTFFPASSNLLSISNPPLIPSLPPLIHTAEAFYSGCQCPEADGWKPLIGPGVWIVKICSSYLQIWKEIFPPSPPYKLFQLWEIIAMKPVSVDHNEKSIIQKLLCTSKNIR